MSGVTIVVRLDDGIERFAHRLAALADRLPQIEREGLQEGGKLVTTQIRRTLRAQMNTKGQAPINARTTGALVDDRTFVINGTGKGLPIKLFPVKGGRKRQGNWKDQPRDGHGRFGKLANNDAGKVVAQSWGASHRFKRSYALSNGDFVARLPGTRKVRALYGPSVAKEITKDQSAATFEGTGASLVEQCIIRRLGRLV